MLVMASSAGGVAGVGAFWQPSRIVVRNMTPRDFRNIFMMSSVVMGYITAYIIERFSALKVIVYFVFALQIFLGLASLLTHKMSRPYNNMVYLHNHSSS
jgi:hypothetical protein